MAAKRRFGRISTLALVAFAATQLAACSYLSTGESSAHYTPSDVKQPKFSHWEEEAAKTQKAFQNMWQAK